MNKIHPVIVAIIAVLALVGGFLFGMAWQFEAGSPISKGEAVHILETARDSHEYWAGREDEAWWAVPGQDAEWVIKYQGIIDLIKQQ